jgi:hypothetical protein
MGLILLFAPEQCADESQHSQAKRIRIMATSTGLLMDCVM